MLATSYPLLDIFWTMLEIFLFVIWIWLLIIIFRTSSAATTWAAGAKALWVIFVIIIPFLGILVYLIARGGSMQERAVQQAKQQQQAFDGYVKEAAGDRRTPTNWPSWPT